ncbi:MAG: phage tail tape measure protein, partial [Phycisphaerae bacterium]|nr:phage tail tape measure protein [Phycisphaerae bacterium]
MMKGLVAAAQKQEDAERALAGALRATGDEVESNMDRLKDYASQIQRLTTHGDEEVLQQMAYARNLGVTSDALADVTKGASGLATALNLDLATAMRYTSTALQGDFTILRRYIPELRSTSDAGEQLAIVQRKMAEGWQQSQERAMTSTGQIQQARNRIGDVAEAIGVELLPTMAAGFQKLAEFLETNQDDFAAWAKGIIGIMGTIGKGFSWIDRMRAGASGVLERQAGQSVIAEQARQRYLLEQPQDKAYFDWFADQKKAVAFGGVGAMMAMKDRQVPTLTDPGRLAVIQNQLRRENDVVVQERERLARELESKRQTIGGQYDPLDLSKIGAKGGAGAAAETVKSTDDITAAMARMYDQIDSRSAESFAARANLLNEQAARYVQMGVDIVAVIEWIKDQEDKLAIDQAKKTGSFFEGFGAGVRQMQREVKTIGELGAEAAETIRDGLADAFTDA